MNVDLHQFRRPVWILSLTLIVFYVATGVFELLIFGETGTATFVLSAVTAASLCAAIIESRYEM